MPFTAHAARQTLGFHAGLELADVLQFCFSQFRGRVAQRVGDVDQEVPRQFSVAGRVPGAQQRLALPGRSPGFVVFLAGGIGAHERAVLAFRAQVQVEFDLGFQRRRALQDVAQVFHDLLGEGIGLAVVGVVGRTVDENGIRIGAEVHFAPAVTAHGDDGDTGRRGFDAKRGNLVAHGPSQRDVDDCVIHVGHGLETVGVADHTAHPRQADAFDFVAAHGAHGVGELVDVRAETFQRRAGLHIQCLARAGLQIAVITEPADRFDRLVERVAQESRVGQDVAQTLGGRSGVTQEAEVAGFGAEVLLQLAPVEQAHVRVLALAQPLQDGGQDDAVDFGRAPHAGSERLHVADGGVRVAEADGFESFLCCLDAQHDLVVLHLGVDRQHRAIVDVKVQVAHFATGVVIFVDEFFRVQAERAGEATQLLVLVELVHVDVALLFEASDRGSAEVREQVRALQGPDLLAMLHHALEAVVLGHAHGLFARNIAAFGQALQRVERVAGAQRFVGAAVYELEHLHGEFHIAQAAAAELDFAVLQGRGNQILHALAHLLAVVDEVLTLGRAPHERPGHVHVGLAEVGVAGHRAGLEQRLELPVLGPLLVIVLVRGEHAHQRAVLAFRAQAAVDLPQRLLGHAHDGGLADALQHGAHLGAHADQCLMVHVLVGRFDHVDEVHIGDVVQFLCAEFAHADDGEAHVLAALDFMAGDGQRAFERRVRKVGQFAADGRLDANRILRHDVLRDDGGQLPAITGTQRRGRFRQILGSDGHGLIVGIGADLHEQTGSTLCAVEQVAVGAADGRGFDEFRPETHELAHRVGGAEHGDQTSKGTGVGNDPIQIPPTGLHRIDDIHEIAQRHVGVARMGQHAQQFGASSIGDGVGLELAEQGASPVEVLQTCPDEVHGAGFEHRRFHKIPLYTLMPFRMGHEPGRSHRATLMSSEESIS